MFLTKKLSFQVPFSKIIYGMTQCPPNSGFMSIKVQNVDFLKKPSVDNIFSLPLCSPNMLSWFKIKIGNVHCPVYILELLTSVKVGKENLGMTNLTVQTVRTYHCSQKSPLLNDDSSLRCIACRMWLSLEANWVLVHPWCSPTCRPQCSCHRDWCGWQWKRDHFPRTSLSCPN